MSRAVLMALTNSYSAARASGVLKSSSMASVKDCWVVSVWFASAEAALATGLAIFEAPVDIIGSINAAVTAITDPDPATRAPASQAALIGVGAMACIFLVLLDRRPVLRGTNLALEERLRG